MATPAPMRTTSKAKLEKIQQKFKNSVDNGKFYEASQMSKTLFYRYKSLKQYDVAETILYESILTLLQHEQIESAFELARLLVSLYRESKQKITSEPVDKLMKIISCSKPSQTRKDFIQESLNWTVPQHKHGHPNIHLTVAKKYWEEKNYQCARQHFIYTSEGSQCAAFLIEYHVVAGFPGEIDLFVTQAVLQYLCLQNILTANTIFTGYTLKHPGIQRKTRPYKQPLLNFIAFLLLIVENGSLEQYTILCEQYQLSINRDPTYPLYLDKIGQLFFGLPPPKKDKSGIQGMIGDLMDSLLGGGNTSEAPDIAMDIISDDVD